MTGQPGEQERGLALPLTHAERLKAALDLAKVAFESRMFDLQNAQQGAMKIALGWEMGFSAFASLTGITIWKGKLGMSSALMGAALQKAGYDFRVIQSTRDVAEVALTRDGKDLAVYKLTMEDAVRSGFDVQAEEGGGRKKKFTWTSVPEDMLFHAVRRRLARHLAPGAFLGMAVYDQDDELPGIIEHEPIQRDLDTFAAQANEHRAASVAETAPATGVNKTTDPEAKTTTTAMGDPENVVIEAPITYAQIDTDLRLAVTQAKGQRAVVHPDKFRYAKTATIYNAYRAAAIAALGIFKDSEPDLLREWRAEWTKPDSGKLEADTKEMEDATAALLADVPLITLDPAGPGGAEEDGPLARALAPYPRLLGLKATVLRGMVPPTATIAAARLLLHGRYSEQRKASGLGPEAVAKLEATK